MLKRAKKSHLKLSRPSRVLRNPVGWSIPIAAQLTLSLKEKQALLEVQNVRRRIERLSTLLTGEIEVSGLDKKVRGRVKKQMEKSQREYYLNEQMKAIQKELGDLDEGPTEIEQLQTKVEASGMPHRSP